MKKSNGFFLSEKHFIHRNQNSAGFSHHIIFNYFFQLLFIFFKAFNIFSGVIGSSLIQTPVALAMA